MRTTILCSLLTGALALVGCDANRAAPTGPDAPPAAITPPAEPGRYVSEIFPQTQRRNGIPYGASVPFGASEPAPLLLDLYEPVGDTALVRPVVLWIHGGGFKGGSRSSGQMVELAEAFARRGYVTASISYRLRPGVGAEGDTAGAVYDAVEDAKAAVRWFRANAAAWRVDTSRIAIGGGSAGAATALGVAYYDGEGASGNAGWSSRVRAVVDFWGMADTAQMNAGEAPLLIVHGTEDRTVPFSAAEALRARAVRVGVPFEFRPLVGVGHSDWSRMHDYIAWITPFLQRHLTLPN